MHVAGLVKRESSTLGDIESLIDRFFSDEDAQDRQDRTPGMYKSVRTATFEYVALVEEIRDGFEPKHVVRNIFTAKRGKRGELE